MYRFLCMKRLGHLAIIAHDMGLIFEFLALITIVPFGVLLVFQEWDLIIPMGSVPFVFIILGFLISKVPKKPYDPSLSVALVAVALTWLVIAAVGALPFVLALRSHGPMLFLKQCQGGQGPGLRS